jgi:hypothetical protein
VIEESAKPQQFPGMDSYCSYLRRTASGKTVRATGKVILYSDYGYPEIIITDQQELVVPN